MNHKLIRIYLNDHLAGSIVGSRLARRIAKQNQGNHYGSEVTRLADEIDDDKSALEALMDRLGVRKKQARLALAAVSETAARLKPNGRLFGYSDLSRVVELEMLTVGITGKLELWQSLKATEEQVDGINLDELVARAEDQDNRVRELRRSAAHDAFAGESSR